MPQTHTPTQTRSSPSTLKLYNDVQLTRELLFTVLNDLSSRLLQSFRCTVRLVVHGGVIMVLHPGLGCRQSTRDVDYNHRSFILEWRQRGVYDAGERLCACIAATAHKFQLGADWMNSCADVALPMSKDPYGKYYDPVWHDATSANNMRVNTIFISPGLVLVGVSWSWAVALKLVRYEKYDPYDIANILRLGRRQRGVQWTRQVLENWLLTMCGAMGYAAYTSWQMAATREKMRHAIRLAETCA
ncbi:hypothetical protein AcW1_003122 [Taiwanofungus camphoratus]|nr:hypothetical protein AcV7_004762 [Antrodia cinnamomea]KAI0942511.1 hypothetical protein AcW1_003122 [Antrodia cinnamomea]